MGGGGRKRGFKREMNSTLTTLRAEVSTNEIKTSKACDTLIINKYPQTQLRSPDAPHPVVRTLDAAPVRRRMRRHQALRHR